MSQLRHIALFLLGFLLLSSEEAQAQTYFYSSSNYFYDSLKVTMIDGYILPGRSTWQSDALLTVKGNTLYKGYSSSVFDKLYEFKNSQLITGSGNFSSDILYTWKNGKIYQGNNSTFSSDCLFTISKGVVYKGDSNFYFDAIYWSQGQELPPAEWIGVLIALGKL